MRQSTQNIFIYAAIAVGILGLLLGIVGAASDSDQFWTVYLLGFLFWLQLALGCLAWLLLASVFDARWSYTIKRIAGAGARTMPLLAILSLPLLVAQSEVFPWAAEGVDLKDGKEIYLNQGFFFIRTVIYFAIWIPLAFVLTSWDYKLDKEDDEDTRSRSRQVSILGIILFFLTATFAAFDWSLSLDYEAFSSIYGWLAISQMGLAAMSFIILVMAIFWRNEPFSAIATPRSIGYVSSLLLVSLLTWAYLSFMQFIIMWSGNIPDKVNWYVRRVEGGWETLAVLLVFWHIVAFVLLVIPGFKRMRNVLPIIAGLILVLRLAELYWTVIPPTDGSTYQALGWELALFLSIGGFWVALFTWFLMRAPLVPENDPGLESLKPDRERYMADGSIGLA